LLISKKKKKEKEKKFRLGTVAQAYNPSYWGGRNREDQGLRLGQVKSS
jgi:hypothetical protein